MALANCSQCGKLFNKTYYDQCPACREQVEQDFETVYRFLRVHGPSHIDTIHAETGVDKKRIMKFLAEDRFEGITVKYKCESCGEAITSGRLCDKCAQEINSQVTRITQEKALRDKPVRQDAYLGQTSLDRYGRKK